MIARVWRGATKPEHADAYEAMLKPELLPGLSKVPGYRGSYFLRRDLDLEVEFVTIIFWESLDSLKGYAGDDYEVSIIPEERRQYLSKHQERAEHFEVISGP